MKTWSVTAAAMVVAAFVLALTGGAGAAVAGPGIGGDPNSQLHMRTQCGSVMVYKDTRGRIGMLSWAKGGTFYGGKIKQRGKKVVLKYKSKGNKIVVKLKAKNTWKGKYKIKSMTVNGVPEYHCY